MAKLTFKTDNCKGCGLCVDACPKQVIALAKDNTELLEEINASLARLKDSGKLQEIIDKYITAE